MPRTGDRKMHEPSDDVAYRSAMNAARDEWQSINEEATRVSSRMSQLGSLLEALKPFLRSGEQTVAENPPNAPQKVAVRYVAPTKRIESEDPIQRRINSALGLAVA